MQKVLNALESGIFPKRKQRKRRRSILHKQLKQVKAGNISENLLNEICQIIYSLDWGKEITKKV